jgi:nitrogen fixation/metabolism regulation signal transduction histidine kinase
MTTTNKRGSAYTFIYVIFFLFVLTILYIVFSQIFMQHLIPISEQNFLDNLSATDAAQPAQFMSLWGWIPFIIIFVVVFYLFYRGTQKDNQGG